MAKISETELQRRLRALETRGPSGGTAYIGTTDPSGTNYVDGDTHYDSVLNNLWIFNGGAWALSNKQLHIRYATAITGIGIDGTVALQNQVTGFSITPFDSSGTQKAWRGLWWGSTLVASTDPTDYEWTLTAGEAGYSPVLGVDYDNGVDGIDSYLHVKYSDDNGATFTANSGEDIGNWIGTYSDSTEADSTNVNFYTWAKFIPEKGVEYDDGVAAYFHVKYSDNGTTFSGNSGEDLSNWIGTYVDTNAADSTTFSDYTWVKFIPEKGTEYDDGIAGTNAYIHIKYSDNGTTFTGNNGEDLGYYIGTLIDETEVDSTTFGDYTWAKFTPEKGVDYDDGLPTTLHIKYSNDGGTSFTGNSGEDIGNWIGTYSDHTVADSTSLGDYTWAKFIPEKGTEYDDGIPGTSAYLHIKYSDNGTTFTSNSGEDLGYYIGTYTDSNSADSTTFGDYTWAKFTPEKGTDYDDGDSAYMHIKYSDNGTTFTGNNGEDVGSWFGSYSDNTEADSTTFSDYTWKKIEGDTPTYTRYYSDYPGLYSEMGDPDTPGTGVTWTLFTGSAPSTAYWVAEQFTTGSTTSDWAIFPVQAKDGGIPFVTYTITGRNMPTLGDSTWIDDAVEAVENFTGRPYTNQKEFGYGTTVVITYDDGKLYGRYTRNSSGADTWVAPASFIDGNLIVDGSIAAEQIDANAINTTHLVVSGTNAIDASAVGADPAGSASAAQAASDPAGTASAAVGVVTNNIYTSGTTTIDGGNITTGTVTATTIKVSGPDSVTASTISADPAGTGLTITDNIYVPNTTTLNGVKIGDGTVTADKLILNSAVIEADGNTLTLVGAALNRTHSFSTGTTTIEMPYGAAELIMTGCGAGGGRPSISVAAVEQNVAFAASGGGGGACLNLSYTPPTGTTHIKVTVGSGSAGGNGGATLVQTASSLNGTYTTQLTLGGGGVGGSISFNYTGSGSPDTGTLSGGSAGTATGSSVVTGFSFDGQSGSGGTYAKIVNRNMSWGYSGGEAGTGTGSPLGDWPHGSSPSNVRSDDLMDLWRWYGNASGPLPVGFGCGVPQANLGAYQGSGNSSAQSFSAAAGGNGYMIISFGA
jgi:hypothetical protein